MCDQNIWPYVALEAIKLKVQIVAVEICENEINDKMLLDLALATIATKIAWSRAIFYCYLKYYLMIYGGNTFQNISSYSQLCKLLEEPGAFSYHTKIPYENEYNSYIMYKNAVKVVDRLCIYHSQKGVIDPWIDTTVVHYDTSVLHHK